jgi:phosphate transport system substrate-binding protein
MMRAGGSGMMGGPVAEQAPPRRPLALYALSFLGVLVLFGLAGIGLKVLLGGTPTPGREPIGTGPIVTPTTTSPTGTGPGAHAGPYEATTLNGPGDVQPQLLRGEAPALPDPNKTLSPTIMCRISLDNTGRVTDARPLHSRPDLAKFEHAALAAIRNFRFTPGQAAGAPVAVNMNWAVTFASPVPARYTLKIRGSETVGDELGASLATGYHMANQDVAVDMQAQGSSSGFRELLATTSHIGMASRPINAKELEQATRHGTHLAEYTLAYDGLAVIVNPANPIQDLTVEQVAQLFRGQVRDWSGVGGSSGVVHIITRPPFSGGYNFFRDRVLRKGDPKGNETYARETQEIEHNEDVLHAVSTDPHAIAYLSIGFLAASVRAIGLITEPGRPALKADRESIQAGGYPLERPLLLYTRGKPRGEVARFLVFALSDPGQKIVEQSGFIPTGAPVAPELMIAAKEKDEDSGVKKQPGEAP